MRGNCFVNVGSLIHRQIALSAFWRAAIGWRLDKGAPYRGYEHPDSTPHRSCASEGHMRQKTSSAKLKFLLTSALTVLAIRETRSVHCRHHHRDYLFFFFLKIIVFIVIIRLLTSSRENSCSSSFYCLVSVCRDFFLFFYHQQEHKLKDHCLSIKFV